MTAMEVLTKIAYEWGCRCFGKDHMTNNQVRALRMLEEAIEVCQSLDVDEDDINKLTRMVYARPEGDVYQELGGTILTLAVLCHNLDFALEDIMEMEVLRVLALPPEHFAKRNEEKLKVMGNAD